MKSRNIQSQCSVTAIVPIPLIGTSGGSSGSRTPEPIVQIKDTSKLQYHHASIPGPSKQTKVQQKLSNESIDIPCSNQNQQTKNEHIVWPATKENFHINNSSNNNNNYCHSNGVQKQIKNRICNYIKRLCLIILFIVFEIVILVLWYIIQLQRILWIFFGITSHTADHLPLWK